MSIKEIVLDLGTYPIPAKIDRFLQEADKRCDAFFASNGHARIPRYIPGDAAILYAAMAKVIEFDLHLGRVYCEWGSGIGIGACLAAFLGLQAYGIEIEPELVDIAQTLAADFNLDVQFVCGSYFPDGLEAYAAQGGDVLMEPLHSLANWAYAGMDATLDEVDIFHVYPWPHEQEMMLSLFDAVAVEGAVLIAYYGEGEMCVYRRVG